jgi:hypothetical protein
LLGDGEINFDGKLVVKNIELNRENSVINAKIHENTQIYDDQFLEEKPIKNIPVA